MQEEIRVAFYGAKAFIVIACEFLEDLLTEYMNSDLEANVKAARISAINAKIGYLKGLKLDPETYPWTEDVVDSSS
jgi:hypothetical protein